jgi:hypothetical protein
MQPLPDQASVLRHATLLGHLTWAVLAVTFVGLLGGLHPSDRQRDRIIAVSAVIVVLLNVPSALDAVRRLRRGATGRELVGPVVGLVVRLGIAAWVLWFAGSISHELESP